MGKPTGLAKEQRRALGRLTKVPSIERFYLAGGGAIAWHLRHRRSNDLDLFSDREIDLERVRRFIGRVPGSKVLSASDAALKIEIEGTFVDLVSYPYPPLVEPVAGPAGCRVAAPIDLAVMKLAAVARRGIRRDFWDLKVLIESGLTIEGIARGYVDRFRVAEGDLYPVLRSLTYFDDAEKDETFPEGMTPRSWQAIKRFFVHHAGKAARHILRGEAPSSRPRDPSGRKTARKGRTRKRPRGHAPGT